MESADDWAVGSDDLNNWQAFLHLNDTIAQEGSGAGGYWNDTAPTASVFSVGTAGDTNYSEDMIAYCFHNVEGYSKIGLYEGNSNIDGPFIYTGFRPAWILVKNTTATGNNWEMWDNKRDTYNIMNHLLEADTNGSRITSAEVDFVSNGFKVRSTSDAMNDNGETLLYLAFAKSPFKTSNAR